MEESGGRKLIRSCIGHLNRIQGMDSGRNRALYPVIMVFFGEEAAEQFTVVRDTLDDNWQNADFLKYINIVKSGSGCTCRDLVTGATADDPSAFAEEAVVEMLGTDDFVFEDKSRIRFEFIMTGEDENARAYYDFMIQLKLSSQYNVFKTMFIMMDESTLDKRRGTRLLLEHITENREKTQHELGTVYLLSNFLKNGTYLLRQRIALNYRLVADLVLLGGNRSSDGDKKAVGSVETYDTIKTAAYALVEKPIRNITLISLRKMMRFLMERNEYNYKETAGDSMQQAEKIEKKLGIQPGKISCVEAVFQESVMKLFPRSEEIQYLAYLSEQDYKAVHKEKRVTSSALDRATGGSWTLFYEENYRNKVEGLLADSRFQSECMGKIEKEWRAALEYGDALYGLEDGRVRSNLESFTPSAGGAAGITVEDSIHSWAVGEARKVFYEGMLIRLDELLGEIHRNAVQFEKLYQDLEEEVRREDIDDSVSKKDICSYYEHLAEDFLRKNGDQATQEIFRLTNNMDQITGALEDVFKRLITSNKIFAMSFEEEMQTRLNTMSDVDRLLQIKNVLETRIEDLVRLHWSTTAYENNVRGTYYLMNQNAEYAKHLGDNAGANYTVFHLNRTDCIEKIAIYDLENPGIHCNLTEMAGEA